MFKNIKTKQQLEKEQRQQELSRRHSELKRLLIETDYVALADYDKEKPELIIQRQEWRVELREIESNVEYQEYLENTDELE
jgi:hypothetical protein